MVYYQLLRDMASNLFMISVCRLAGRSTSTWKSSLPQVAPPPLVAGLQSLNWGGGHRSVDQPVCKSRANPFTTKRIKRAIEKPIRLINFFLMVSVNDRIRFRNANVGRRVLWSKLYHRAWAYFIIFITYDWHELDVFFIPFGNIRSILRKDWTFL